MSDVQSVETLPTDQRALLWTTIDNGDDDEPTWLPGYVDERGTWWLAVGLSTLHEPDWWRPIPPSPETDDAR